MPTVRLLPSDIAIQVSAGTRLCDAIRDAGQPIAAPCGDDLICARCAVRVLEGRVTREAPVERDAKRRNRVAPDYRLACALRVHHDLTVTADYWGALAMSRALLLVDHGSRKPDAHAHLAALAERLRARRPELHLYVAHMELAEPSIADTLAQCARDGVRHVDVFPLFLAPGRHVAEDLPARIREAEQAHPQLRLRMLTPLGERPELADWILDALARD